MFFIKVKRVFLYFLIACGIVFSLVVWVLQPSIGVEVHNIIGEVVEHNCEEHLVLEPNVCLDDEGIAHETYHCKICGKKFYTSIAWNE